jgi:hypothetical protein
VAHRHPKKKKKIVQFTPLVSLTTNKKQNILAIKKKKHQNYDLSYGSI